MNKTKELKYLGYKHWFSLDQQDRDAISVADDVYLLRETEKAACFIFESDYGRRHIWFPKAALITEADIDAQCEAMNTAIKRYDTLMEIANQNDVKVRKRSKVATIVKAFEDAGKFDLIAGKVKHTGFSGGKKIYKMI